MKNIQAFFKYQMLIQNKSLKETAAALYIDAGHLSRILNGKRTPKNTDIYLDLCQILHLDWLEVSANTDEIDDLFDLFLESVFYIRAKQRNDIFKKITAMENKVTCSPAIITIILTRFIHNTIKKQSDNIICLDLKILQHIHTSLDKDDKQFFLIYYYYHLYNKRLYAQMDLIYQQLKKENITNPKLKMLFNYFYFSMQNDFSLTYESYHAYQTCMDICLKYDNKKHIINLKIMMASQLTTNGEFDDALKINRSLLSKLDNNTMNYYVILNNIGWTYSLMKDYFNALKYYLQAADYFKDNEIYFNLAWCYFQMNDKENTMKYLEIGKNASCHLVYYDDLLDWLETITKRRYSLKANQILKKS